MPTTEIDFPALKEVKGKIDDLTKKSATVFSEAGPEMDLTKVKSVKGNTFEIAAQVRAWNDELADLGKKRDDLMAVHKAAQAARVAPDARGDGESGDGNDSYGNRHQKRYESIGDLFIKSAAYKQKSGDSGPEAMLDLDMGAWLKTTMSTGAGWDPQDIRTGRVVDMATRPVQVTDLIPQTTTNQSAVVYMEETTLTNNAAEIDEAGAYQESALALTEKNSQVRKIGTFLPITDEQLEDEGQVRGYVDNRLPFMIRQKLDSQLLVGSGTGTPTQLRGILNVVGIGALTKGADPGPDAVYKAMVNVRVTGRALPNGVVFHPTDWQNIRLLRTADGIYIWGNPSDVGVDRIWGLQVTQSDALTLGTVIVGDFANYSELAVKRGVSVQVSNSHASFFTSGIQAMRADMRAAFVVYRPAAFCKVTGF